MTKKFPISNRCIIAHPCQRMFSHQRAQWSGQCCQICTLTKQSKLQVVYTCFQKYAFRFCFLCWRALRKAFLVIHLEWISIWNSKVEQMPNNCKKKNDGISVIWPGDAILARRHTFFYNRLYFRNTLDWPTAKFIILVIPLLLCKQWTNFWHRNRTCYFEHCYERRI